MLTAHTHFTTVRSHPCMQHPTELRNAPVGTPTSTKQQLSLDVKGNCDASLHRKTYQISSQYNQKAKILYHHKNFGFFSMLLSVFPHFLPEYPRYDGQFFLLPSPTSAFSPNRQWFLRKTVCVWALQAHRPQWYKAAHLW